MRYLLLLAILLGLSLVACTRDSGPVPPFKVGDTIVFNTNQSGLDECSYKPEGHKKVEEIRGSLFKLGDGRWVNLYQVHVLRVCSSGD